MSVYFYHNSEERTYCVALQIHLAIPQTRNLVVYLARLVIFDCSGNSIVSAGEVSLCFEFDVAHKMVFWAFDEAVIAEFVLHLSEKDTARIHVRLCQVAKAR